MSRVRQEAKIIKNHHRECVWNEYGGVCYIKTSRYNSGRINTAYERLRKAMRRRYRNAARREWNKNGYSGMYRFYNHKACCETEIWDDSLRWWNIPY